MATKDKDAAKADAAEQESQDVNERADEKRDRRAATGDSGEPTGAHRHWAKEGFDVVTFDDEPPA